MDTENVTADMPTAGETRGTVPLRHTWYLFQAGIRLLVFAFAGLLVQGIGLSWLLGGGFYALVWWSACFGAAALWYGLQRRTPWAWWLSWLFMVFDGAAIVLFGTFSSMSQPIIVIPLALLWVASNSYYYARRRKCFAGARNDNPQAPSQKTNSRPISISIACTFGVLGALSALETLFVHHFATSVKWLPVFLAGGTFIGVFSICGIWRMKSWGVITYIGIQLIMNITVLICQNFSSQLSPGPQPIIHRWALLALLWPTAVVLPVLRNRTDRKGGEIG